MDERERILSILREALPQLSERFKARWLALFGSVAHGECGEHSGVDLLVEFEPGASLFDLVAMGDFLEGRLGRRVDLSTPECPASGDQGSDSGRNRSGMSSRGARMYLEDIVRAMQAAESFVRGMSFEDFLPDDRTASAVIRKLEIIGETTRQIPAAVRHRHPDVPWNAMAGMRDRLIHACSGR